MPFNRHIPHPLRSTPRRDNSVVFEYNDNPNFDEDSDLAYESTQTHIESCHLPVGRGQPSWNNSDRLEVYPTQFIRASERKPTIVLMHALAGDGRLPAGRVAERH